MASATPAKKKAERPTRIRVRVRRTGLLVLLVVFGLPWLFVRPAPPPPGTGLRIAAPAEASGVAFLADSTAVDARTGERIVQQRLFDALLDLVRRADSFVYVDFFLWNDWTGLSSDAHRALSLELADALVARRRADPGFTILALTDPINAAYGGGEAEALARLRREGIPVVYTDLDRLPDSNRLYAVPLRFWGRLWSRLGLPRAWMDRPLLPNPLVPGGERFTPRQAARLLLFKANHRKLAIADVPGGGLRMLVTSMNPADGSSLHDNVGLLLDGPLAAAALRAELEAVAWSAPGGAIRPADGWEAAAAALRARLERLPPSAEPADAGEATLEWLTEGAVPERIEELLAGAEAGDAVDIALFYLSDRPLVAAIRAAAERGASVRLILDPNRDAFGRRKSGIPNRPIARELLRPLPPGGGSLVVRWADTHGEQFHAKAIAVRSARTGGTRLLCGSSNWTRRNLRGLNMEACVLVAGAPAATRAYADWFDGHWENRGGRQCTLPYAAYAEGGWRGALKSAVGRLQEATGLGTF